MGDAMSDLFAETDKKPKKGLAMARERKIHCRSRKLVGRTICGKKDFYVKSVYRWVFEQLQVKSKCRNCMRKENANL